MFLKPTDSVIVYWQRFIFDKIHRVNKRTVFTNTCLGLTYQLILSWESPYVHGAPVHTYLSEESNNINFNFQKCTLITFCIWSLIFLIWNLSFASLMLVAISFAFIDAYYINHNMINYDLIWKKMIWYDILYYNILK